MSVVVVVVMIEKGASHQTKSLNFCEMWSSPDDAAC